jgi:hypothetical protein
LAASSAASAQATKFGQQTRERLGHFEHGNQRRLADDSIVDDRFDAKTPRRYIHGRDALGTGKEEIKAGELRKA